MPKTTRTVSYTHLDVYKRQGQRLAGHIAARGVADERGKVAHQKDDGVAQLLTRAQIDENAETYKEQVFKILDEKATEVRYNSEWLGKLGYEETIRLTAHFTVSQMLERDDFSKRFQAEQPISLHELLYPVMQGYDSVSYTHLICMEEL